MTQGPNYAWVSNDNPWRQGSVLSRDHAVALGVLKADAPDEACAVVITHDCDIAVPASGAEPCIELIVGTRIGKADPELTTTKSLRRIHLPVSHNDDQASLDLSIHSRVSVAKAGFEFWNPSSATQLEPRAKRDLRRWLAARYARESFPNNFNVRLERAGITKGIERILSGDNGKVVTDIYFKIEGDPMAELSEDSPYALRILVAHADDEDAFRSGQAAKQAAEAIGNLIEDRCFDAGTETWHGIHLRSCTSQSISALTLAEVRNFQVWRLEHVTVRRGGEEPVAPG